MLQSSPNGDWTLAFPVLGIGYFGWEVGEAVRVLLASVANYLRDCRAPKLRLVMVVPQDAEEVMVAVKKERELSASVANLDGRFEVRSGESDGAWTEAAFDYSVSAVRSQRCSHKGPGGCSRCIVRTQRRGSLLASESHRSSL